MRFNNITNPLAQKTTESQTTDELIQASEGAKEDLMQRTEGVVTTTNRRNKRRLSNTRLQSMMNTSPVAMRKRLKTTKTGRQTRNSLKARLQGSVSMATLAGHRSNKRSKVVGGSYDAGQFQQPQVIEAWTAEVTNLTKEDIPGEILCLETMFPDYHQQHMMIKLDNDPLYAYKATSDPDTMYMHQAMKEPNKDKFKETMVKEAKDQMENGNFSIVHRSEVPKGKIILPTTCSMADEKEKGHKNPENQEVQS